MSRYDQRSLGINDYEQYDDIFEERGVKRVEQYRTPTFKYFNEEDMRDVDYIKYIWKKGDSFWKLSKKYLGNPRNWWVIASFNKKPTEAHIELGEVIKIPLSLAQALQVIE